MTETGHNPIPETAMPVIANFIDWHVPTGFETFAVVQKLNGPLLNSAGEPVDPGPVEHHYGVGHRAQLPAGEWLIVRPGDHAGYTTPGYFLAKYSSAGRTIWGQKFSIVEAALDAAHTELRTGQQQTP